MKMNNKGQLKYSESDVKIIRMGTSGGIGVKPGTLIVTEKAFSPLLKVFNLILSGESII